MAFHNLLFEKKINDLEKYEKILYGNYNVIPLDRCTCEFFLKG